MQADWSSRDEDWSHSWYVCITWRMVCTTAVYPSAKVGYKQFMLYGTQRIASLVRRGFSLISRSLGQTLFRTKGKGLGHGHEQLVAQEFN